MSWYCYILHIDHEVPFDSKSAEGLSKDKIHYIGTTNNVNKRIIEHSNEYGSNVTFWLKYNNISWKLARVYKTYSWGEALVYEKLLQDMDYIGCLECSKDNINLPTFSDGLLYKMIKKAKKKHRLEKNDKPDITDIGTPIDYLPVIVKMFPISQFM